MVVVIHTLFERETHIVATVRICKVGGRKGKDEERKREREKEIEKDRDTGQIERAKTPRGTAQLDRGRSGGEIYRTE